MTSTPVVAFALNPAIINKPATWEPRFAGGWQSQEGSLEQLRAAITAGTAFIGAALNASHRSSAAFCHSDLAVVDIDGGLDLETFLSHPLATSAAYVYTTASHQPASGQHRFRVLFRLPRRLSDPDLYKALVTRLTRELGGDRSCTDPCRLFYANSAATEPLWQPEAVLTESWLEAAAADLEASRRRYDRVSAEFDDVSIQRAIHVLEQVIEPTCDGERDRFIKVTAAASSAGEVLYPAWSDWASRGHHGMGKNARQTSEKFFRGFHGRSSLATLFFLAAEADPDWRRQLPPDLQSQGGTSFFQLTGVAGYDHEDFLGEDYLNPQRPPLSAAEAATASIFDLPLPEATTATTAVALAAPSAPAAAAAPTEAPAPPPAAAPDDDSELQDPGEPPAHLGNGALDDYDDSDDDFDDGGYNPLFDGPPPPAAATPPGPGGAPVRRGRRGGPANGDAIATVKTRLQQLYPGLRLNAMSLDLEYGPASAPRIVHDISTAYIRISAGTGQVFAKTMVYDVAQVIGQENQYHPVKAYLEYCAAHAEPCPYFSRLASELLGISSDPIQSPVLPDGRALADVILERFLIGAVARVLQPGCTHDWMPILIGSQNSGKSTFFQYLTPPSSRDPGHYPWVSTIQQGITYLKDKPHTLHASWLVVLDEAERYFKRQYTEELKNLVSVSVDRSARKYENERSFPRAFVLCGATNANDFLCDPTGNRRFLPIQVCGKVPSPNDADIKIIDLDRLKVDRDAIWAAAYRAYLDTPVHTFSSYELSLIEDYLSGFQRDNPIEAELRRVLEINSSGIHKGNSYVLLSDVFKWMDVPLDRHSSMQQPITDAMKRQGWRLQRVSIMGRAHRIWTRPAV